MGKDVSLIGFHQITLGFDLTNDDLTFSSLYWDSHLLKIAQIDILLPVLIFELLSIILNKLFLSNFLRVFAKNKKTRIVLELLL